MPDLLFGVAPASVVLLDSDDLTAFAALGPSPWGIYQNGAPIVVADTVADIGYVKAYTISDYPIEDGGFASYDKVETPFEGRVRFASGGSSDVRQALLLSIEGIIGDLNFYDLVTPDRIYINANVVREEYRRTQQEAGASLLTIDVALQEVRILSGDIMNATQDPASADQQNGGTVQAQSATPTQTSLANTPGALL